MNTTVLYCWAFSRPSFPHDVNGSFVKELVASKNLVVFSKSYCPYCHKAKQALAAVGAKNYEVSHCRGSRYSRKLENEYGTFNRGVPGSTDRPDPAHVALLCVSRAFPAMRMGLLGVQPA